MKTTEGQVRCARVVLAGNVYLGEYGDCVAPSISARIMPVGTYMLATEPLGAAHADASMPGRAAAADNVLVLDYFRLSADHRLLFGAGETYHAKTPRSLVERMVDVFPLIASNRVDLRGVASSISR